LDEEGLYVGRPPSVVPANLRRLENRIIQETKSAFLAFPSVVTEQPEAGDTDVDQIIEQKQVEKIQTWFKEDGNFALLPNPLRSVPQRPPVWDELFNPLPPEFQVDYIPPMTTEMTFRYLALENDNASFGKSMSWNFGRTTLSRRRNTGVGVLSGLPECRLDVEIRQVVFDFHPLYTWEHVHAQNLRQIVMAYQTQNSRDQVNACIERLRALRRALEQLKKKKQQAAEENSEESSVLIEMDANIEQYEQEISLIRRSRNHAEAIQRGLLASALRAWKRVKQAREKAGFTNTTVRLNITQPFFILHLHDIAQPIFASLLQATELARLSTSPGNMTPVGKFHNLITYFIELVDRVKEQKEWDKELEDIVEEARRMHERQSKSLRQTYAQELVTYRQLKKHQAAAMRRQRMRESGKETNTDDNETALIETEKEDAHILAEARRIKAPVPPAKFNAAIVRDQAETQMMKSRRLPGEPKITVALSEQTPLTPDELCPESELLRRAEVAKYSYYVKLYFNHKYVEKTNIVYVAPFSSLSAII
uniref:CC2D2AN-C2 domain-containing protein n=1 Tax=Echinostoma caproni TaxID=27848 RepID=A0A183AS51_9TREM